MAATFTFIGSNSSITTLAGLINEAIGVRFAALAGAKATATATLGTCFHAFCDDLGGDAAFLSLPKETRLATRDAYHQEFARDHPADASLLQQTEIGFVFPLQMGNNRGVVH
jgi:hypothetical protein